MDREIVGVKRVRVFHGLPALSVGNFALLLNIRLGGLFSRLLRMVNGVKVIRLDDLRVGDAVRVHWFDASEATCSLAHEDHTFDTPVRSYGVFLGVKGLRAKHVIVAKEVVERDKTFHYNAIPLGMIERLFLLNPADLERDLLRCLRRKVVATPLKRFRTGLRGGTL